MMSSERLPPSPERARPRSCFDLFLSFTLLALQGFGGVLAIVQHELVEKKKWLTRDEFIEDWAVAQIMPGPNVVNISLMIGARYFGLRGALAALAGMLTAPLMLLLIIAVVYAHYASHPGVAAALKGMSAVTAGLLIAVGLKLAAPLKNNVMGKPMCLLLGAACFIAITVLRIPLVWIFPTLGVAAFGVAYRKLKP